MLLLLPRQVVKQIKHLRVLFFHRTPAPLPLQQQALPLCRWGCIFIYLALRRVLGVSQNFLGIGNRKG